MLLSCLKPRFIFERNKWDKWHMKYWAKWNTADPSPPPTITPQYGNQWHSGMSPHHYEIVMLPSNVQKCYGCGAIFSERSRSAPFNLCIKHVDKRVIGKNADGHLIYSRDYTNTYYHPSMPHMKCILDVRVQWTGNKGTSTLSWGYKSNLRPGTLLRKFTFLFFFLLFIF